MRIWQDLKISAGQEVCALGRLESFVFHLKEIELHFLSQSFYHDEIRIVSEGGRQFLAGSRRKTGRHRRPFRPDDFLTTGKPAVSHLIRPISSSGPSNSVMSVSIS